jgi:hypothetical protein
MTSMFVFWIGTPCGLVDYVDTAVWDNSVWKFILQRFLSN